jgi:hypothetical protein
VAADAGRLVRRIGEGSLAGQNRLLIGLLVRGACRPFDNLEDKEGQEAEGAGKGSSPGERIGTTHKTSVGMAVL